MWRLSLDMGTNSIGWVAFELNNSGKIRNVKDAGVRIFSDGREPSSKDRVGQSLAVERRLARGARRNRDRRQNRKRHLVERLINLGLLPECNCQRREVIASDPYKLRAEAVDRVLTPYELGRVLFHINQRRGFLSNCKSDSDDEETGKIKPKISELRKSLDSQTLGQWLNTRLKNGKSVRFRGEDGDLYADRAMYLEEFDAIRAKQYEPHNLSSDDWDDLRNGNKEQGFDGIFFQRKLKQVERGRCEFFTNEYRAHKDLPIAQEFRILQEIANLQYNSDGANNKLNEIQRTKLLECLSKEKTMTFGAIRKLKLPDGSFLFPRNCTFNFEEGPRDKLNGNATAFDMRNPGMLGDTWDNMTADDQNDLLEMLHDAEDKTQLVHDLMDRFSLSQGKAESVSKFKLSPGTGHLSRKFMMRCADIMRDTGKRYDQAVTEVWDDNGEVLHHSHRTPHQLLVKLPYYGKLLKGSVIGGKPADFDANEHPEQYYGKINNPTVHVALNQLRKLVNRLIDRFGLPDEIHVELVRDLKRTAKARDTIIRQNKTFAKANDNRTKLFCDLFDGQKPTGLDLKKIRLWEELGSDQLTRQCPFSGRVISANMLFNGEAEIEHILPFARTLDSSSANLTIAVRPANRLKGNQTPYEAFSEDQHADKGMIWEYIDNQARSLPQNKRWRFYADAMDRFEEKGCFIARQLTDNAYISKVTKQYLSHICNQNNIHTIPGGLTAMMRGKWHLNDLLGDHNYKERNDHRHHIIDAFVVGLTDRRMLQQVSNQAGRSSDGRVRIVLPDITCLRDQIKERIKSVVVSYKQDHGTNGKMFNETAYGNVPKAKQDPDLPGYNLVTRKKLETLSEKEIGAIRNHGWRILVQQHIEKAKKLGKNIETKALAKALVEFGQVHDIKTIRILVSNQSAKTIASAPYKSYAPESFVCVDIWQIPKGKPGKWEKGRFNWKGAFWSYAECKGKSPDKTDGLIEGQPIHPAAKFITRLFKNDLVELIEGGQSRIMRVAGFSTTNNKVDLRPQYNTDGTRAYTSINVMSKAFKQKLRVYEDGSVKG